MKKPLLCVLSVMLAACSSVPQQPAAAPCLPRSAATRRLDEVIRYYDRLKKLDPTELANAHRDAALEFSKTRSDMSRMKLAMLLWLPGTSLRDTQSALQLLNGWPKRNGSDLDSFAELFDKMLEEQQASKNSEHRLEQMLRAEKKRGDVLQKKINAVKKMEKTMIHMEKP